MLDKTAAGFVDRVEDALVVSACEVLQRCFVINNLVCRYRVDEAFVNREQLQRHFGN